MKSLVFDSGPVISLTLNNLLWIIEPLHDRFKGDFFLTGTVYHELIGRPLETKKYKFEALQILPLVSNGTFEMLNDPLLKAKSEELLELANHCFRAHGNWINIVHLGEMEVVAAAILNRSEAIVVDERTTRDLIENPRFVERRLADKLHTRIETHRDNLKRLEKMLQGIRVIRSFELVAVAFDIGLLQRYMLKGEEKMVKNLRKMVLEGVLWAVKLSGCSVRSEDIDRVLDSY